MNPIVAARTALWEAQGSSRRDHAQAPPQRSEQCFPGTSGVRLRATAPEPFGMPRDGIGERIDTAFRSPSEAFFRRPVKPNDTSLPLLHQRSFDSRSGFYWSSAADSPEGGPPRPQEGRRAVPAYQVVRKRQPGSVEKSPPKRAFLRQNTHPVPPLYAASDGCFKASLRPLQGPKRPEKGGRTLKKEEKTVFSRWTRIVRHLQTPPAVGDQDGTQTNGMNFAQACCDRTQHRSSSRAFQS